MQNQTGWYLRYKSILVHVAQKVLQIRCKCMKQATRPVGLSKLFCWGLYWYSAFHKGPSSFYCIISIDHDRDPDQKSLYIHSRGTNVKPIRMKRPSYFTETESLRQMPVGSSKDHYPPGKLRSFSSNHCNSQAPGPRIYRQTFVPITPFTISKYL